MRTFLGQQPNKYSLNPPDWLNTRMHESEYFMSFPRSLGYRGETPSVAINFPDSQINLPSDYLCIAFSCLESHPWHLKRWPLEHWVELLNILGEHSSFPIVIIGGPSDCDDAGYLIRNSTNKNVISFCGQCSLLESAFILSKAKCLVSVDNGISHLAASSSIASQLLLYGPTLLSKNIPLSPHTIVLKSDKDCQPCFRTSQFSQCQINTCMIDISPNDCFLILKDLISHL